MSLEKIIIIDVHLQRTSEADVVPAKWAINEAKSQFDKIPSEHQDSAVWHGWRGSKLSYSKERSELELAKARSDLLLSALRAANRSGLTAAQVDALVARAGG